MLLSITLGCSKDNEKEYCWDCEVYRSTGGTYRDKKCFDYPTAGPPMYEDANGNSLQVFCQKNW